MELTGIIKKLDETKNVTDSFRKREVVVTTEEQYPQHVLVEFVQDKTSLLDAYKVGDKITIGINLRGREWTSPQGEVKYFNSIHGWRIEGAAAAQAAPAAAPAPPAASMPPLAEEDDDLPF